MKKLLIGLTLFISTSTLAQSDCSELIKIAGNYQYKDHKLTLTVEDCKINVVSKHGSETIIYDGKERSFSSDGVEVHNIVPVEASIFDYFTEVPILTLTSEYKNTSYGYMYDLDGNEYEMLNLLVTKTLNEPGDIDVKFEGLDENNEVMSEFSFTYKKL